MAERGQHPPLQTASCNDKMKQSEESLGQTKGPIPT